jgi:DNA-binding transcriptional ArsR family regulator
MRERIDREEIDKRGGWPDPALRGGDRSDRGADGGPGSPKRIALLDSLRGGEANVQQLADDLDLTHRNASHHAAILHRAGLLTRRREGRQAIYAIEDWSALWLIEQAARALVDPEA